MQVLLFRCWRRGNQESNLIFGPPAETCVTGFNSAQLGRLEALLDCADADLFDWVVNGSAPPKEYDREMVRLLRAFCARRHRRLEQNGQPRT